MTYPVIASVTQTLRSTNVTSHSVALPATVDSGDILLVLMAFDGQPTVTWDNTTAGSWTNLHDTLSGAACRFLAYYKVASGSEDGLSLGITTSVTEQSVAQVFRITGGLSVECGTAVATGTGTSADAPNVTPSWGADDTLWIVGFGLNDNPTSSADPTNYTTTRAESSASGACTLIYGSRAAYGASENPAAMTISVSAAKIAQTYAIRPATTALTATGSVTLGDVTAAGTMTAVDNSLISGAVTLADVTATGTMDVVTNEILLSGSVTLGDVTATGAITVAGDGRPDIERAPLIAIEITAAVDEEGTLETFYLSDAEFQTEPTDTPPNVAFDDSLLDPGSISISAFGDARTGGATRLSLGEVRIANVDGAYDHWLNYGFDGRPIVIRRGGAGAYPSAFTEVFSGTMAGAPLVTRKEVVIRLRDRQYIFDRPALTTTYAGDNSLPNGLEGTENDVKGQVKPRLYGKVTGISPPCVNTSKLTYQISDGGIFSVDGVYDRGAPITFAADYATADLLQAALVADGTYATCVSAGLFRLGSDPAGQITCDATQGAGPSARTAAQIISALAESAGVDPADISADDVAALDAANPSVLGLWINTDETFISVLDRVASSVGAYYTFDQSGTLRMGRLMAPEGQPELTIEEYDAFDPFERRPARDGDIPVWKVTVRHSRNHTVQANDIAESVDVARRASLASEWRSAVAEDPSVKDKHLLAEEWVVDTLLTSDAEAQAEADRLLAMYSVRTDFFDVTVRADMVSDAGIWLMGSTALTNPRFGLQDGRLFRLLGIKPELAKNRATLSLWGTPTVIPPPPPPPPPLPPALPAGAMFYHVAGDDLDNGAVMVNKLAATSADANIFGYSTGVMRNEGTGSATIPAALTDADDDWVEFQFASTTDTLSFWNADLPTAGDYSLTYEIKSAPGSGTWALRHGWSSDLRSFSCTETPGAAGGGYSFTATGTGTSYSNFTIRGDGTNVPHIFVRRRVMQQVATVAELTPWEDLPPPAWHARKVMAWPNSLPKTGAYIDNSGSAARMIMNAPSYPLATDLDEITLIVGVELITNGSGHAVSCDVDAKEGTGTTTLGIGSGTSGNVNANPVIAGLAAGWARFFFKGENGVNYLVLRLSAEERRAAFNEVDWNWDSTGWAGIAARTLRYMGASSATNFKGRFYCGAGWPYMLTDDQVEAALTKMDADLGEYGVTIDVGNILPVIGDSRSATIVVGGTLWDHQIAADGHYSPERNLFMYQFATGGQSFDTMLTEDFTALKRMAYQGTRRGRRMPVAMWLGTNDAELDDDTSVALRPTPVAYWEKQRDQFWRVLRAQDGGDRIFRIAFTECDRGSAGWADANVIYSQQIRDALGTEVDAYVDLQASAIGAAGASSDPALFLDAATIKIHPGPAGQDIVREEFDPIVPVFRALTQPVV